MNAKELQTFEQAVAEVYEQGTIRGPIHLSDGNEQQLINIFKDVGPHDYVFSTWRSHYHALLKGVPQREVLKEILAGRSITLQFPEHNFYSSAIVGGNCSPALGAAWGIKDNHDAPNFRRAWCFVGDMAAQSGIFNECVRYSIGHDLPITWVVEDNGKSVGTPTEQCSMMGTYLDVYLPLRELMDDYNAGNVDIIYYKYEMGSAHAGIGKFVEF